jgi:FAD/FMN-containing dehydrogenase/Fe-S oxidoreductase
MSASKLPIITEQQLRQPIENRPSHWRHPRVDVGRLQLELRKNVEGEVRFDAGSIQMYSLDGSNYQQMPIGVVVPKSIEDAIATVDACRRYGAPLLSRTGGTSLAGQCCNYAIVIDWTKYTNRILEVHPDEKWAWCEPGVIRDQLADAVCQHKLTYGPDPSTHTHCCIGGMLGNNSCGAHAQFGGKAVDNVEEMDVLLYDGTRMTVGWMTNADLDARIGRGGREGQIYARLKSLRDRYTDKINTNYPHIPRRVSGYNLDQLIPGKDGRFNVARALVGSEGTLATILKAKVGLVYSHPERVLLLLGYPSVYEAADHLMEVLESNPIALEGIDDVLYKNIETKGGPHSEYLGMLPKGKGWLMIEYGCDTQEEAADQARQLMEKLKGKADAPSMKLFTDKIQQRDIWRLRESGLGATAFVPGQPITWEGWEDSAVAPKDVGSYLRDLRALYNKYNYKSALYGHFGMGCIHCRVSFDLFDKPGIEKYMRFLDEATTMITSKYNGSLSGEHGDGQSKAMFLEKMFGPELIQAFREFKSIWDPDWKMNPGKVVDPYHPDQNLRLGPDYKPWEPETHFQWPNDNGHMSHATLRCVGVGNCRRLAGDPGNDTMCPSFMVTREEKHSTRGRAHLLWEMLKTGNEGHGWRDEAVKEALDLCLACKGCKGDCPVNVDVANYKAEFLSHYWEGRLRPRYAYAFGLIDQWSRVASLVPGFANLFTQLPGLSAVAKIASGMPQQRQIPAFAPYTFKSWFKKNHVTRTPSSATSRKVILWADTFNNYFFPETAQAAAEVLADAGCDVHVPMQHLCCGRPLYDYGFLDMAKSYLHKVMNALRDDIEAGTPIVVLEPSCASVFRDELNELMPKNPLAKKLVAQTFLLSEFLEKKLDNYRPPKLRRKALVHGHCHHKAIMRMQSEQKILKAMDLDYNELASGCCGMAGSFGYEKDKYDVSIKVGERVLLPAVRKADVSTIIIADGFSCKEQVTQETPRKALHLAEVIKFAKDSGHHGGRTAYPEHDFVAPRIRAQKRSMLRAGIITGGALVAGAWLLLRKK